jgi:UDP-N-acetylmuramoylalanine--D-glutamate ligase
MMDLSGKRVAIVGLGRSGLAAAVLCRAHGAEVVGTDRRPESELTDAIRLLGIRLVVGVDPTPALVDADLVVVSPGVPPLESLERAARSGVEVIGELELASRFIDVPVVAIGGTNGKSTVTTLVADLLEATGARVFRGGNLGVPLSEAVASDVALAVVEVSSFQLERAPTFRPAASVLLNVSEDHLDRYPSFEAYARAKGNAFVNQTSRDVAIVPEGDRVCYEQAARGAGRRLTFGGRGDYVVDGGAVLERSSGLRIDLADSALHGAHNLLNAAAAIAVARALGAEDGAIRRGVEAFRPLPHRMMRVRTLDGVSYYDDSKATNVGAAVTALSGLSEERAVLIAGGRDKQGSYEPLAEVLRTRGRAVVAIGEAAPRIAAALEGITRVVIADSIEGAVGLARSLARPGDAVILSPACSSFDWFSSYAERGERFVEAVERLDPGRSA